MPDWYWWSLAGGIIFIAGLMRIVYVLDPASRRAWHLNVRWRRRQWNRATRRWRRMQNHQDVKPSAARRPA